MKPQLIKAAMILAVGSLLSAAFSLFYIYHKEQSLWVGNLVFAAAGSSDMPIKEIIVKQPHQTITLTPENSFWQIKEADNYYAAFDIMRNLRQNINEARFTAYEQHFPLTEDSSATSLQIIGENGKELNHIILIRPNSEGNGWLAKIPAVEGVFTISGKYAFPDKLSDWTQQPLLSLEKRDIQSISVGNKKAFRNEPVQPFVISQKDRPSKVIGLENIERHIIYLPYIQVMSAQNFDDTRYPDCRNLSLALFSGLVYNLRICTDNQDYWAKLTLSTTTLPTSETNDYIRYNAFLYDGWFFKLPESTGRLLYQYHL